MGFISDDIVMKHAEYSDQQRNLIDDHLEPLKGISSKMKRKIQSDFLKIENPTKEDMYYYQRDLEEISEIDSMIIKLRGKLQMVCCAKFMDAD